MLSLLLLSACNHQGTTSGQAADLCQSATLPISAIQGDDFYSPLENTLQVARGTVTHVVENRGVIIEDAGEAWDGSSSRALLVEDSALADAASTGQVLVVSGYVTETGDARDKQTSITRLDAYASCGESARLPQTAVRLPLDSRTREALESMRVAFGQELTVTDVYRLAQGELTLSSRGVLRIPTETGQPGNGAAQLGRENRSHSIVAKLPRQAPAPLPVGSRFTAVNGLLGHDGRGQQLLIQGGAQAEIQKPDPLAEPPAGSLRVVSANLLNFFNGDGRGGGFPTERGAKSAGEYKSQSARIRSAMARIQPDLLAVQELENDGFGEHSAARSLIDLLNETGAGDWSVVDPGAGRIGDDVITVGLFYRRDRLEAVGESRILTGPGFDGLSRQPLAQLFRDRLSGTSFLVAANHLKSKGSCPDSGPDTDQGDGQGCWNVARTDAVNVQTAWLQDLSRTLGTAKIVVLGDMNAYRMEDPVTAFKRASFIDLVEHLHGLPQHTFLFWGQVGTLDYIFASPEAARYARAAQIWHINANYARRMDHGQPWLRFSDHDPVIVDFDFSQSATSP